MLRASIREGKGRARVDAVIVDGNFTESFLSARDDGREVRGGDVGR